MKRWTERETDMLRELWQTNQPARAIAERIGRPLRAVYVKAHKLGLPKKKDPKQIELSDEELLWLKLNFPHMRNELCAMRLGISPRSVVRIARDYRIDKTPRFMEECRAFSSRKANEANSRLLKGKYTPNLQKGTAYRFKKGHDIVWTADKDKYLIDNYPYHTASYIAEKLGFTCSAVTNRCASLKLTKTRHKYK